MANLNLTYKQVLLYSPYDNRYNLDEISLEQFKSDLRIIPNEFSDWMTNLKRYITPGDFFKHMIVMHGYSGCGKTTFLEWFKEKIQPEGYHFKIINPILKGHGLIDGKDLIEASITSNLIRNLSNKSLFNLIVSNSNCFLVDPVILSPSEYEKIKEIVELYSGKDHIANEALIDLLNTLCFRQKLILYITSTLLGCQLKKDKSFIFCFDNLDEILLEYISEEMWKDILDVSSKINGLFNSIGIPNLRFKENVVFLMVFREANFAVSSTATLLNRIRPIYEITDKFVFPCLGKSILTQRREFCQTNITSSSRIADILKILSDEQITEDILLPMFNYDTRKLSQTSIELVTPKTISGIDHYMCDVTEKSYKSYHHDLTYGKRGVLINGYIRYLSKNNFLKNLAPIRPLNKNDMNCNKARLILTVLSNKSYPAGFPQERGDLVKINPIQVTLLDAFIDVMEIITPQEYVSHLQEFFNLEQTGWAHLITIYGKTPVFKAGIKSYNLDEELDALNEYYTTKKLSSGQLKAVTTIQIQLNASGFIYLKFLITHFEYFLAYKTRKDQNNWHLDKPLFYLTGLDIKEVKWDFEKKINEVVNFVEVYCYNMLNYFKKIFQENLHYDESRFCQSKFVFKDESALVKCKNMYGFYGTRLISSHIQYIETFRHFMLTQTELFNNIPVSEDLKQRFLDFTETQDYLIGVILKYLTINKIFNDPTATYIDKLEKLAEEVRSTQDYNKWIKI